MGEREGVPRNTITRKVIRTTAVNLAIRKANLELIKVQYLKSQEKSDKSNPNGSSAAKPLDETAEDKHNDQH